jgi:hypothetical protein
MGYMLLFTTNCITSPASLNTERLLVTVCMCSSICLMLHFCLTGTVADKEVFQTRKRQLYSYTSVQFLIDCCTASVFIYVDATAAVACDVFAQSRFYVCFLLAL